MTTRWENIKFAGEIHEGGLVFVPVFSNRNVESVTVYYSFDEARKDPVMRFAKGEYSGFVAQRPEMQEAWHVYANNPKLGVRVDELYANEEDAKSRRDQLVELHSNLEVVVSEERVLAEQEIRQVFDPDAEVPKVQVPDWLG